MTFRHPLVRAAVYQGIPPSLRLAVHKALAQVLDRPDDDDRRAWHRAMAATGPDEEVATELERTGVRASDRHGYAAAATAYERAARLSARPESRARRLTLAAETAIWAGSWTGRERWPNKGNDNSSHPPRMPWSRWGTRLSGPGSHRSGRRPTSCAGRRTPRTRRCWTAPRRRTARGPRGC
ncbi:hypothetical protein ACFQX6_43525 [Streptosporangium lutulentum]